MGQTQPMPLPKEYTGETGSDSTAVTGSSEETSKPTASAVEENYTVQKKMVHIAEPEQSEQQAEKQLNDIVSSWMRDGELVQTAGESASYSYLQQQGQGKLQMQKIEESEQKFLTYTRSDLSVTQQSEMSTTDEASLITVKLQRKVTAKKILTLETDKELDDAKPVVAAIAEKHQVAQKKDSKKYIDLEAEKFDGALDMGKDTGAKAAAAKTQFQAREKQAAGILRNALNDLVDPAGAAKRQEGKKEPFSIAKMGRANLEHLDLKRASSLSTLATNASVTEFAKKLVSESKSTSTSYLKLLFGEDGPIPRATKEKVAKILEGIIARMSKNL